MISVFLTGSCVVYIILIAEEITADLAGASLALALQTSVVFQMCIRLLMGTHARMSSAECIISYAKALPTEQRTLVTGNALPSREAPVIKLSSVNMRYRKSLPLVLRGMLCLSAASHIEK